MLFAFKMNLTEIKDINFKMSIANEIKNTSNAFFSSDF